MQQRSEAQQQMADINALSDWRFSIDVQGIAWAVFDRQGESQNALSRRALEELGAIVERVAAGARDRTIAGLVFISGKDKGFIVGADVREFDQVESEAQIIAGVTAVNACFDSIERLPVPVVCCIHGFCLGGGLELALACHWRIATRADATRLGFPEVRLGIFPGFNGTVRSIRQIGALAAMPLMLRGAPVAATRARAMGLVDELVASPLNLPWSARRAIAARRKSPAAGGWKALLRLAPARALLAGRLRTETAKRAREEHYPAPFRLIDLFEAHAGDLRLMKAAETRAFAPLMVSDTARNLLRVFKLSEMLKAQAPKDAPFRPLRVHVIGAGVMGADIAGWCAACGMEVSLQDMNAAQIGKGIAGQQKLLHRKFRTRPQRAAAAARLLSDPTGEHIPRADVVIEAIVERLEAKQALFKSIEGALKPGAVLATNTSSIPIEKIAEPLADPGRLIGLHFFNPVAQLPLVEVVRGGLSRDEEVGKGCLFLLRIDKLPLIVKSSPGFLVNRVLGPYLMQALQRLEHGEDKEKIDAAARDFGMPMGPIELADWVGLDVCALVGRILGLAPAGPNRLEERVAAGKLGRKSGEGFYQWKDGKAVKKEPPTAYDRAELQRLGRELVDPLIAEAEKVRDEKIADSADLVDAGIIFATGFAPFRGGPLHFRESERKADVEVRRLSAAE
jgi:3-hydroxyacyl-CoA dehydrogenase/enoyl-CoA hydratase/3-hydroxybutyryl-CoA epimerase